MGIFRRLSSLFAGDPLEFAHVTRNRPLRELTERDLIRMESEIGAQIFGPLAPGRHREFFCLDPHAWVWYEEWTDASHQLRSSTVRYEINDTGVLKVQDGSNYNYIEGEEYEYFTTAVQIYYEQVMREIYRRDPSTGQLSSAQQA